MADKELGALPAISALLAAAIFHSVQDGNSRKVTAQQIADFVNGNYPEFIRTLLSAQSAEDFHEAIGTAPDAERLGGQLPSFFATAEALDLALQVMNDALADKVPSSRTVAGKALTGNITLAKADVGLGNVSDTSDANKPVSIAQAEAINAKFSGPAGNVASGDIVAFSNTTGSQGRKATQNELKVAIGGLPLQGYISAGFNLVRGSGTSIVFPAGQVASDNANPILMTTPGQICRIDAPYDSDQGGRFEAALANGWWHFFVIGNGTLVNTGASRSLNPTTQPNYPAGYTHYRRVASFLVEGGNIVPTTQNGDFFGFTSRRAERNSTAAQAPVLLTISTPLGIVTEPSLSITQQMGGAGGNIQMQLATPGQDLNSYAITAIANEIETANIFGGIMTNMSSQIYFALEIYGGSLALGFLGCNGYIDKRGRL
ncbi:hypothetical protein G6L74_09320 [Agrobacterium tumefaciens]|uniref:hypothetical protein n=1 Tax=Agrobacterium tumefaciens TaxID=358 RepID=UPI001573B77B|nr:hypothetical protein [Agrobacterium tumefaciens]